jgi:hypothetical protein
VGLLWRLFAPRPLKKARRAMHPSWVIEDAIVRSVRGGKRRRAPARKSFHATVTRPDGSVYKCHHQHRTEGAALECAQKYQRGLARKPPERVPPERSKRNVAYDTMYDDLIETALSQLAAVDTPQAAQRFIAQFGRQIQDMSSNVPEFYTGEFLNAFKDMVVGRSRTEVADCERVMDAARSGGDAATTELTERLDAARAAGDRTAEHQVWKEREARQAACQSKLDAASHRIDLVGLRIDTCKNLASALGFPFT